MRVSTTHQPKSWRTFRWTRALALERGPRVPTRLVHADGRQVTGDRPATHPMRPDGSGGTVTGMQSLLHLELARARAADRQREAERRSRARAMPRPGHRHVRPISTDARTSSNHREGRTAPRAMAGREASLVRVLDDHHEAERQMTATIEADGLTKHYGKTTALDGLDLIAEQGQVTAVLGPNGAGKTTFVRMVATLLRADKGTLLVAGHDARKNPASVRRVIGLAGQFAAVEPAMTGRENLEMVASLFGQSRRAAKESAAGVLDQLGLVEAGDRLARTYSGGMRRRLDLGASLVGAPRLLLLDEPTTGLDPRSRIELWDAVRALVRAGTDVLLTTQYLDEADHLASQIVIIDHGRAVAAGTPAQLKQRIAGDVIEVHVRDSRDVAIIAELLGRLGEGVAQIDEATRRVSVRIDSSGTGLVTAMHSLHATGVELDDIAMRQPNLDEVFLTLTGQPTDNDDLAAVRAA